MQQKGFVNIIIVIALLALMGIAAYIASNRVLNLDEPIPNLSPTPQHQPTPVPLPIPTPNPSAQNSNILSVIDLTGNKAAYLGKKIRVQGKIRVNIFYGEIPCPGDGSVCDRTMGAQLELWQLNKTSGSENLILIFSKDKPYPCKKIAPETYSCAPFINDKIITIEGVWIKDQVPIQWIGSSGGGPPTPIKWESRYFLNVSDNQ